MRNLTSRLKRFWYEGTYSLISVVAIIFGFRLYNRGLYWVEDPDYLDAWSKFPETTKRVHDRKFILFQLAKSVADISGDTVECGVFTGGSSFLICEAKSKFSNVSFEHHVFDSFQGLSNPSEIDLPEKSRTSLWQKNDLAVSEDRVRKNLSRFSFVKYYQGWIPERFSEVSNKKFSFVHVDVDLYQPTFDSLKFFYERMNPGGILLCDDYGFESCPGAYKAFNDLMQDKPEKIIQLSSGQGFIIKR
jgi:O-methyltransferase